MWRCAVVLVALVSLTATAADDEKDKAVKQEQEKLQGKWKVVSYELLGAAGKESYDEPDEFKGDKWLRPKRRTAEYRLKLDPSKDPKLVDLSTDRLGDKVLKGIYKLDGDKLTICYAFDPDLPRPTEFKTKAGERCYLCTLERVKK